MLARTLTPKGSELWDPTLIGEENEALLIRVWKPLPTTSVLKLWDWRWYVMGQSEQYLLVVVLNYYNGIRARHGMMCQQGRWTPKGSELWDPTSVRKENEVLLIRVWKPLPARRVLKSWGWRWYVTFGGLGLLLHSPLQLMWDLTTVD